MGLGNFPADFPARDGFATNEGIQVNAMKAIVDRLVEPRNTSKYDYSLDNDMNERSDFEQQVAETWNTWVNVTPGYPLKIFLTLFVWYPFNAEYFGMCGPCLFTLLGFVEKTDGW